MDSVDSCCDSTRASVLVLHRRLVPADLDILVLFPKDEIDAERVRPVIGCIRVADVPRLFIFVQPNGRPNDLTRRADHIARDRGVAGGPPPVVDSLLPPLPVDGKGIVLPDLTIGDGLVLAVEGEVELTQTRGRREGVLDRTHGYLEGLRRHDGLLEVGGHDAGIQHCDDDVVRESRSGGEGEECENGNEQIPYHAESPFQIEWFRCDYYRI